MGTGSLKIVGVINGQMKDILDWKCLRTWNLWKWVTRKKNKNSLDDFSWSSNHVLNTIEKKYNYDRWIRDILQIIYIYLADIDKISGFYNS